MLTDGLCHETEYNDLSAAVAAAMDAAGPQSLGCTLRVGLKIVEGAMGVMDPPTRREVREYIAAKLDIVSSG